MWVYYIFVTIISFNISFDVFRIIAITTKINIIAVQLVFLLFSIFITIITIAMIDYFRWENEKGEFKKKKK